ncbi:hypothetical protein [uncultured Maritalea sp.]|uniref:hypothetical protein n=1 Tax=uncultured Maritalea sp. TaxID=757249 RepID=UPI00261AE1A7|nr:hypothetical protein [uncultured Maritalea sp.]
MDFTAITEFILIFLFAATKFAMAVGYMLLPTTNYNYLEIVAMLITAGSSGVIFFYYTTGWINIQINSLLPEKKKKKVFTRGNRRFINIKNKYGLIGISLLTPVLLSIPLGCFLASRYFSKNKYTLLIMIAGIVFWGVIFPLIKLVY